MTETVKPLGARVYEIYLKNLETTPGLDPKEALADAYRKINPQKDIQDFISDVDDSLWYKKNIKKKIHDLLKFHDLLEESNLEHITFTEVSTETDDFIAEDAISLRPWMERWKGAHFYKPDSVLMEAATAGKKDSSNISWIGYDKKKLRVGFKERTSKKTGKVYPASTYEYDVEPKFYEYMAGAPSKGEFLWNYLRGRIPGRVIDKPWKMTPGGVGGSIVPYSKKAPRTIPARQIKRIQKKFGGEIKRGTRLVEQSKVRAKKIMKVQKTPKISPGQTALIQKLEKRYKRDFEDLDVKGYTRTDPKTGKKIEVGQYSRTGEAKKEIMKKIKGLQKTPLPGPGPGPGGKKPPKKPTKKGLTPEERIRKGIEHQARGIKKQPAPDKREEAVQKLIEQTGYERKRAEAKISKQFGPSKQEAAAEEKQKKAAEKTQQQVKQKQQQLQHSILKLQVLNQRNFKSEALKTILQLFGDLLKGKGTNIIQVSRKFKRNYERIQRDQTISLQKKSALLNTISRLNQEIQGLSAPQKDFEVSDAEKKDGFERCVAWMEEKGETDDPEGICFGILEGKKKKPEDEDEEEEEEEGWKQSWDKAKEIAKKYREARQRYREYKGKDFINTLKNSVEDQWITKKGRHIWLNNWYTPEELNIYNPKTGAGIHEVEPWLRIDRSVDIKKEGYSVGLLNRTLETFPLKLKNMINEIRVFNKITDHPSMRKSKGKVPKSYQRVGWDKTYDQIGGVYLPSENNAYITPTTSLNTIRHELGHAVYYGLSEKEKFAFARIWHDKREDMYRRAEEARRMAAQKEGFARESYENKATGYEYEANDITEFFAESFARYYKAKRPTFEWEPTRQKQPYPEVAKFFRERMRKYEKNS